MRLVIKIHLQDYYHLEYTDNSQVGNDQISYWSSPGNDAGATFSSEPTQNLTHFSPEYYSGGNTMQHYEPNQTYWTNTAINPDQQHSDTGHQSQSESTAVESSPHPPPDSSAWSTTPSQPVDYSDPHQQPYWNGQNYGQNPTDFAQYAGYQQHYQPAPQEMQIYGQYGQEAAPTGANQSNPPPETALQTWPYQNVPLTQQTNQSHFTGQNHHQYPQPHGGFAPAQPRQEPYTNEPEIPDEEEDSPRKSDRSSAAQPALDHKAKPGLMGRFTGLFKKSGGAEPAGQGAAVAPSVAAIPTMPVTAGAAVPLFPPVGAGPPFGPFAGPAQSGWFNSANTTTHPTPNFALEQFNPPSTMYSAVQAQNQAPFAGNFAPSTAPYATSYTAAPPPGGNHYAVEQNSFPQQPQPPSQSQPPQLNITYVAPGLQSVPLLHWSWSAAWTTGAISANPLMSFFVWLEMCWGLFSSGRFLQLCRITLAPPPWTEIGRYESNKPIKSKLTDRQSINQSTERFTMEVCAWLIDFAHGRKIALRVKFPSECGKWLNLTG